MIVARTLCRKMKTRRDENDGLDEGFFDSRGSRPRRPRRVVGDLLVESAGKYAELSSVL